MFWDQSFEGTFVLKLLPGLSKYQRQFTKKDIPSFFLARKLIRTKIPDIYVLKIFLGAVSCSWILSHVKCVVLNNVMKTPQIWFLWNPIRVSNLRTLAPLKNWKPMIKTKPIYNHDYLGECISENLGISQNSIE